MDLTQFEVHHSERVRTSVPRMDSARYVKAKLFGLPTEMTVWLQNETPMGYWIQIDPDGPYRLVEEITEL
jgi:hypothetical protein